MSSSGDKPSIAGILRPLDSRSTTAVESTADGYLSYFNEGSGVSNVARTPTESPETTAVDRRRKNALAVTNSYYDLATDFYEYGWGESFHFAVLKPDESREHSFAKHEYFLAMKLALQSGDKVLDIGCGIGGPARHISSLSEANIIGLNCNEYQLSRARILTQKSGLSDLCTFVKGDFHHIPYQESHFDKVYAIEATCHSPDLASVYCEVYRVLKPGGMFALYEWVMTEKFNHTDPYHKKLKEDILEGDGLSDILTIPQVHAAVRKAGFELLESRDRALEPACLPWYSVLQSRWTLSDVKITPVGRWATHMMLTVLETLRMAPRGSVKVHRTLCKGADALAAAGVEGIFTPMHLLVLRKPATDTTAE